MGDPTPAQRLILERIAAGYRLIDIGSQRPKFYRNGARAYEPDYINPVDAQSVKDEGWVQRGYLTTDGRAVLDGSN